jgi:hypothetical protein
MRSIFDFSAKSAKIVNCMAKREGFESPRPFQYSMRGISAEFGSLFGPNKKQPCRREFVREGFGSSSELSGSFVPGAEHGIM